MSQTIVVPLDGSDLAERALPWAAALARATGNSVTLIQVIPWPLPGQYGPWGLYVSDDLAERIRAETGNAARDYLERLRQQLASDGVEAHTAVELGSVVETILDAADEHGASAIAIGTHGHGGLTRFMIGSVAQQLVQQALIPVLVVRSKASAEARLGRVLVGLDGSSLSESALELACGMAPQGSTLILARIIEPIEIAISSGAEAGVIVDSRSTQQSVAEAEAYLARQSEALSHAGIASEQVVLVGRASSELRNLARERHADLVVMSTHGRTGLDRLMLGSVADDLVRHAEQPVFMVSARALAARMVGPFSVRDVMTNDIASVGRDEALLSIVRKLLRRRVSGAPVTDADGILVGVISEHDLVSWHARFIAETGRDESLLDPAEYHRRLEGETAGSIMTSPAIAIEADAPLSGALHLFVHRRLRRLPVTHAGKLVGIVTRSDVLRAIDRREAVVAAADASAGTGV